MILTDYQCVDTPFTSTQSKIGVAGSEVLSIEPVEHYRVLLDHKILDTI